MNINFNNITKESYWINSEEILNKNIRNEEYIMLGKDFKKLDFVYGKTPASLMKAELISFTKYKILEEKGFKGNIKIAANKELLEFVTELDSEMLEKMEKNCNSFKKLRENEIDSEITYFETIVFNKFNHFSSKELLKILYYLTYNHSTVLTDIRI